MNEVHDDLHRFIGMANVMGESYLKYPAWIEKGRVPCLDGIRAISIVLVLVSHAARTNKFPWHIASVTAFGRIGVDIFFTISGFLITLLLLREISRTGEISLVGFYKRRILRIIPAYVAYLLSILVFTRLGFLQISRMDWISAVTYTVNFRLDRSWAIGHIWSLSIEEQFYLLWPCLLLFVRPSRATKIVLSYLMAAPLLRLGLYSLVKLHRLPAALLMAIGDWTPIRADSIAVGCLLALFAVDPARRDAMQMSQQQAQKGLVISVGVLVASLILGFRITAYGISLYYSINAIAIAGIVWCATKQTEAPLGRFLQSKVIVMLGILSYSLYLWQQVFLDHTSSRWICQWPQNLCLAFVAAISSYVLVERPFLRLKQRTSDHAS